MIIEIGSLCNRINYKKQHLPVKWGLKLKIHQKVKATRSWNWPWIELPNIYQMVKKGTLRCCCLEKKAENRKTLTPP